MLRATKILGALSFALAILFSAQDGQAQTYEMGPFHVEGIGITPAEAQSDAYDSMFDVMQAIEATLPPGEAIINYVIVNEGLIDPNTYEIDFYVVIGPFNPVPPGGGPGM